MHDRTETLRHVAIDEIDPVSLDAEDSLLLDTAPEGPSPRDVHELVRAMERNGVSPSQVEALRIESPALGRASTGSGDLYRRATEPQKAQEFGTREIGRGFRPDYLVVPAPETTLRGETASIARTVEQLQAAQDTIEDVPEPVDFTGEILIENRPDSVLSSVADLAALREEATRQGFTPLYSFDLTVAAGREMLSRAESEAVRMVRRADGYEILQ